MYIASDMLDFLPSHRPDLVDHPMRMDPDMLASSKKRKRSHDLNTSLSSSTITSPTSEYPVSLSSTLIPTPADSNHDLSTSHLHLRTIPLPPIKLAPSSSLPKRRRFPRPLKTSSTSQLSNLANTGCPSKSNQSHNISVCHICHRRPTTVRDLSAYAHCESCEQWTCYICMRTCEGPGCRSSMPCTATDPENQPIRGKNVCGKCCVEVGAEGRVWCLACYEDDGDGEDEALAAAQRERPDERDERVQHWLHGCGKEG